MTGVVAGRVERSPTAREKVVSEVETQVLIVGGGGAGLTASMLLSKLGVESLLVSRLPETSILPKAHVLNQRCMEIFDEVGVADAIYRRGTPAENMRRTAWYAGLAGPHDGYGRRIGIIDSWGAGYTDPMYVEASAYRTANLPQIRLEPLLRAQAEELNPGGVRFHHELVGLVDQGDGVTATVRNLDDGSEYRVRARYLIGADGGRTVGRRVGVDLSGQRGMMRMVSVHLSADLSAWAADDDVLIRWMVNPDSGGSFASGVLVPMGPDHWGPESEEWVFHQQYQPDDPDAHDPARVLARLRTTLGLPDDLDIKVHNISGWMMEGLLADRFRSGSVFLVGDAAHRHPPTGGLGLTSAVHDVYNLCWKLAYALRGLAGDGLLDSYEPERRAADGNNVTCSLNNAFNHFAIDQAIGLSPEKSAEENWAELRPLWADGPRSAQKRHAVNQALVSQSMEFHHINTELGYTYDSTAVVDDGTAMHVPVDPVRVYQPWTRPGHPLPHAFVERAGERLPIGNLVHGGRFLLLAGENGQAWVAAAEAVAAETGVPITAGTLGMLGCDYIDVRGAWTRCREISPDGAVLVRPDRYIAFRSVTGVDDPVTTLRQAMSTVLSTAQR
jgi:2,4-dichlorophenol 6-monooxygenase